MSSFPDREVLSDSDSQPNDAESLKNTTRYTKTQVSIIYEPVKDQNQLVEDAFYEGVARLVSTSLDDEMKASKKNIILSADGGLNLLLSQT